MKEVICDLCNSTMEPRERLESKKSYRIRRFECACGYTKTVFGEGTIDNEMIPQEAIDNVEKMYKQQEKNNL